MPYPGTLTPGEGETETVSPVMPSARAQQPQSIAQLQAKDDVGAQVDLRAIELAQHKKVVPPKGWLHFVAGGAGGMCGAIITSPLDVVKTRLQSDMYKTKTIASASRPTLLQKAHRLAYHFVETGHLLRDISTTEGPRALFRGLGPTLVGVIPARSINFYTYGNGKALLAERFNNGKETSIVHLGAAAIAGIVTATATNPIWVVKTRLQLDSNRAADAVNAAVRNTRIPTSSTIPSAPRTTAHFSTTAASRKSLGTFGEPAFFHGSKASAGSSMNSMQMALHIVRKEGIKGLYKGMSASYLGVAEGTIQWVLYEKLKRYGSPASENKPTSKMSSMVGAAGLAKLTASLITYPHEVLRTRLRQQAKPGQGAKYTGLAQTFKLVVREEGVAALYGGLSAHLLRVVPNAIVMFSIYELTLNLATTTE